MILIKKILNLKLSEIAICIAVILSSFLYKISDLFSGNIQSISILGIKIEAGVYGDIEFYLWLVFLKLVLIIYLIIWLFTCKFWWKHIIFIPLTIEFLKFFSFLNKQSVFFDEIDYLHSLPITIPIISGFIFILSLKNQNIYYMELTGEIDNLFYQLDNNTDLTEIDREFANLKSRKSSIDKSIYIKELKEIRNKIYNDI